MENISSMISKKSEKIFFDLIPTPTCTAQKSKFLGFFEITLEMFSILKCICLKEILAEKNYPGCFREVRKFKKYT